MALRKPVRITDDIRALVPGDDALDVDHPATKAYLGGEDPDPNKVIFRGQKPAWFTLRPLNQYLRKLIVGEARGNPGAIEYWTVRACLKSVEHLEWWQPRYETWHGQAILTLESVLELDGACISHLSMVVWAASILEDAKKKSFTSSPGATSGPTTPAAAGSTAAPSPATPAQS